VNLGLKKSLFITTVGKKAFEPGRVIIENLGVEFARTIGNALRRILLKTIDFSLLMRTKKL